MRRTAFDNSIALDLGAPLDGALRIRRRTLRHPTRAVYFVQCGWGGQWRDYVSLDTRQEALDELVSLFLSGAAFAFYRDGISA